MHLFLCLPLPHPVPHSPQPLQTFPSHHSLWCSQNCHSAAVGMYRILYRLSPLTLWMLHLRGRGWVQAEHVLTHTLIWGGVFGTQKEHLLWQWTSVPERQEQKIYKWQVWKGFWLKDKQNKTHFNRAWVAELPHVTTTTTSLNCSATEDTRIRNCTLCSTAVPENMTFRATSDCAPRVVTQEMIQSRRNSHLEVSRPTPCCRWSDLHSCCHSNTKLEHSYTQGFQTSI